MLSRKCGKQAANIVFIAGLLGLLVFGFRADKPASALAAPDGPPDGAPSSASSIFDPFQTANRTVKGTLIYLPGMFEAYPRNSAFGVEAYYPLIPQRTALNRAELLNISWTRMADRISWRDLQPNPGDPIRWNLLKDFENELRTVRGAGFTPIVVINDPPDWALIPKVGSDGKLSLCAPIRSDKFEAFASFIGSIVNHYQDGEFNVHDWELGNEPDVDPAFVPSDSGFGCWGDSSDPDYFGGKYYGEMIKAVSPAIKAEDPAARIWIGGLLLHAPGTAETKCDERGYLAASDANSLSLLRANSLQFQTEVSPQGMEFSYAADSHPENFFKGILESGAAPYFDIVAYHWYPSYYPLKVDFDECSGQTWDDMGGGVVGKAKFLQGWMADYGVEKPIFLNETALGCMPQSPWCASPGDEFFQAQADFLVRSFVRGISQNVMGFSWYMLEDPEWRYTGLLDDSLNVRPAYIAYQQLSGALQGAVYTGPVDYGSNIEGYTFTKGDHQIQVLWAKMDEQLSITLPALRFVRASAWNGASLQPFPNGSDFQIPVGFSPIYVEMIP